MVDIHTVALIFIYFALKKCQPSSPNLTMSDLWIFYRINIYDWYLIDLIFWGSPWQYNFFLYWIIWISQLVDGGYGQWTSFTKCSKSCGEGSKTRTRKCVETRRDCSGPASQVKKCKLVSCPGKCRLLIIEITIMVFH